MAPAALEPQVGAGAEGAVLAPAEREPIMRVYRPELAAMDALADLIFELLSTSEAPCNDAPARGLMS